MDEQEYNRIVDDYIDVVYKMAVSYTKSYHDANDIVQNVFMKLYQKSPTFNDEDHIRHWLIRVTINESKNLWNSFWRKNIALENDYEVYEKTEGTVKDQDNVVLDAIMTLPKKYRVVIHLYYYEGYQANQIAEILKEKESTIRTRLVRARAMMKEQLKEEWLNDEQGNLYSCMG